MGYQKVVWLIVRVAHTLMTKITNVCQFVQLILWCTMLSLTVWRVWSCVLPVIVSMLTLWVNLAWQHAQVDILLITGRENVYRIAVIYISLILWQTLRHVYRFVHHQHTLIHFSSNAWQHVQIHTTHMVATTHVCNSVHLVSLQMTHRNLV